MPGYAPVTPLAGMQQATELFVPSITGGPRDDGQFFPKGMIVDAVDAYFGFGRFMYLKAGAGMDPGALVTVLDETFTTVAVPDTANLGAPLLVSRAVFVTNSWGWFQFEGVCPIKTAASVTAAAAIGIGSGGGVAGANSNGKQILNARNLRASTFALTKTAQTNVADGGKQLFMSNVDGLFKGLVISGTGITGGTTVASVDPSGRFVTMSATATATGTITATFTYTGFLLVYIACPFTQGAVA